VPIGMDSRMIMPHIGAVPKNLARARRQEPGQHLDRRRLSGPVWTEIAGHFARRNRERDMVHHRAIAVLLRQTADVQHTRSDTGGRKLFQTVEVYSGPVQNAQRRAAMGTSLRHSGHFFVVGSGGVSPRRIRATKAFTGTITKK